MVWHDFVGFVAVILSFDKLMLNFYIEPKELKGKSDICLTMQNQYVFKIQIWSSCKFSDRF